MIDSYEERKKKLIDDFSVQKIKGKVRLEKKTSNIFRNRNENSNKIDVTDFCHVLYVDEKGMTADVEGMATYEQIVDETLKHGLLPLVVPELKTITIGGAAAGGGIESSSFKHGGTSEKIVEMEILTGRCDVVRCSRDENSDLFFGFLNSYGSFGYVLRLKIRLYKAKPYVKITHKKFSRQDEFLAEMEKKSKSKNIDFLDGVIFGPDEHYVISGKLVDEAPYTSDYTRTNSYYKSIRQRKEDYLSAYDYIWRWDSDWFWCSKNFLYPKSRLIRAIVGKGMLNSKFYWKLHMFLRKNLDWLIMRFIGRQEYVVQDVEIPIAGCGDFIDFFHKEIGIRPVWVCPMVPSEDGERYSLYKMKPGEVYLNFGFWDMVRTNHADGHFNKKVEAEVQRLSGKKSLYSTAYFDEDTFWKLYNRKDYMKLKEKFDPDSNLKDIYEKCVKNN